MHHDPFAILGLPRQFALSSQAIERAYLARAASLHPDLAGVGSGPGSADLNLAKDVLLNPELRANALLGAMGGPSKSDDKSLPPGFLVEIMEAREGMEAAVAADDAAGRAQWLEWAVHERSRREFAVDALFVRAAADPALLREVRRELNAWRYIERMIEQLDPAYDPARADFPGQGGDA